MKLVTEYLEQAVHFERMAEREADEELKAKLLEQASNWAFCATSFPKLRRLPGCSTDERTCSGQAPCY